jgi:hypothetical protein
MIFRILLALVLTMLSLSVTSLATEPEKGLLARSSLNRIGPLAQVSKEDAEVERAKSAKSESEGTIDEAPLLEFVEKHQPELLKLLKFMKKKQPQQYGQAMKELSRVKQRLNTVEKRDAESYAIELELWQVRSQLRMLVAEILVSDKAAQEKLRKQLHALAEKEIDLDSARLQLELKRVEQRLASLQSQLKDRTGDREAALSKSIKTWENRAFKSSARPKKQ